MAELNRQKRIWVSSPQPTDNKAKAVVICTIIILGVAALLLCIFGFIPAILSDVADFVS